MSRGTCSTTGTRTGVLVSWMLLLCGLVVWSAALLVPSHVQLARLEVRHAIMQQQAEHLSAQRQRYEQFEQAVSAGEPAVVEMLAIKHLNLQPSGKLPVDLEQTAPLKPEIALAGLGDPAWRLNSRPPLASASVDDWVYQAMPNMDATIAASTTQPLARSRLARLTSGYNRLVLALAGGLLLVAGLWPTVGRLEARRA